MMSLRKFGSVLAIVSLVVTSVISADEAEVDSSKPMTAVDLISLDSISQVRLTKDAKQVLFNHSEADWKKDKRVSHIWRVGVDGSGLVKITNGATGENDAVWSPDARLIAFIAKRDGDKENQIYLISNSGGEAQRLSNHKTAVKSIEWSPNGSRLYFLADEDRSAIKKERKKLKDDMIRFDDDKAQRHIWFIDIKTKETGQLTSGDYFVRNYSLSPDGSKIVHDRAPTSLLDDRWHSELWMMDADGGNATQLTDNKFPEFGARVSPDNSQVLFRAGVNASGEPYYNDNLFILSAAGGDRRILMEDLSYEIDAAEWGKTSKTIFFVGNMGVHTELFELNVERGSTNQLTSGEHAVRGWDYVREQDRHIVSLATATSPGDIWLVRSRGRLNQITHIFDVVDETFELPRVEAIKWESNDGTEIEGLLYYPLGYTDGADDRRYPLVVQTHGGPLSSDKFGSFSTSRYAQVLTARGYTVLQPNYRGSVGYGDTFARDMVGGYFTNAHIDVMAGVDAVIEMGVADPDKMIKMGWSAGGHLTNKIITFTDRFKAASSGAGAVNWISMYGQSDVRINRTPWFGNTPWVKNAPIDVYWNNSPLKDIWKVKTPTLVLVGEKDERVPPPQSMELFRALKFNGVQTKLYMAPGEPHGWRKLSHRLFKINVELEWFEKHALGSDYVWEQAPKEEDDEDKEGT